MSACRWFLPVCALVVSVAATGACSTTSRSDREYPPTAAAATDVTAADLQVGSGCRRPLDVDDPVGALAAAVDEVVSAVDVGGAGDGCAVDADPVCAALFLIGVTDPIAALGVGISIDDIGRLAELHHRVLVGGAEAANQHGDVELGGALQAMIDLDVRGAIGRDDAAVAAIAVARTDPAIVGPIASAESYCR